MKNSIFALLPIQCMLVRIWFSTTMSCDHLTRGSSSLCFLTIDAVLFLRSFPFHTPYLLPLTILMPISKKKKKKKDGDGHRMWNGLRGRQQPRGGRAFQGNHRGGGGTIGLTHLPNRSPSPLPKKKSRRYIAGSQSQYDCFVVHVSVPVIFRFIFFLSLSCSYSIFFPVLSFSLSRSDRLKHLTFPPLFFHNPQIFVIIFIFFGSSPLI